MFWWRTRAVGLCRDLEGIGLSFMSMLEHRSPSNDATRKTTLFSQYEMLLSMSNIFFSVN